MRSLCCNSLVAFTALLGVSFPCFGQNPIGPATLENLVNADEANGADAVPETEAPAAGPKRPAGTMVRPKDGVQHPDLDKAWAEYEIVVANAAEGVKTAITKQFDDAAKKGDLDTAEKWQAALDNFEKDGALPSGSESKVAVSAAVTAYKKAKEELGKVYQAAVIALTMEKKIAEAKSARDELRLLSIEKNGGDAKKPKHAIEQAAQGKYHMLGEDGHGLYFLIEGDTFILRGYHNKQGKTAWQSPPAVAYSVENGVLQTPAIQFGPAQQTLQWDLRSNSAVRIWKSGGSQGRHAGRVRRLEWKDSVP